MFDMENNVDIAKDIAEKISDLRKHEDCKISLKEDLKKLEEKIVSIKSQIDFCENAQRNIKYKINQYLDDETNKNQTKKINLLK